MLRSDCEKIYTDAITACMPNSAVTSALKSLTVPSGRLFLVAIGKAAWQMAHAAYEPLKEKIYDGAIITKYAHSEGKIGKIRIFEAGHPVPDKNTLIATDYVLNMTHDLSENDTVLFLVSGGGSALFESIDCKLCELQTLTQELLASGASIDEINIIRKHISNVKGGRFAEHCMPAKIFSIVLSDVLSNKLDIIASGPACADTSTADDALKIIEKYGVCIPDDIKALISRETPKVITNTKHIIAGSVSQLCDEAAKSAEKLGYNVIKLTDRLDCEAREAGRFLGAIAKTHCNSVLPLAFIAAGETVVHIRGNGKGGRNQEIALSAAEIINGVDHVAVFSVGSDGTDGPTDAAGGFSDGKTWNDIISCGKFPREMLDNNDSYNALTTSDGLIFTGPTGTNVNDISVVLINPNK